MEVDLCPDFAINHKVVCKNQGTKICLNIDFRFISIGPGIESPGHIINT